jgi:hydroxypyruvate isomerase
MQTRFPFAFAANLDFLFTELAFADRFAAAAEAGFGAVEFAIPYRLTPEALADRLRANGLELALFNAPAGDWDAGERGLAALAGREAEFRASLERARDYALATGARKVHVMAGRPTGDRDTAWRLYEDNIAFAADAFARDGITALIEPINGGDMPGYLLGDFDRAAATLARLARPNLRLQFDVYHRQVLCGEVTAGLEDLAGWIAHVQIAAPPDRGEPDRGALDFAQIFETLAAIGYRGAVGCEYHPRAGTREGLGWVDRWRMETKA